MPEQAEKQYETTRGHAPEPEDDSPEKKSRRKLIVIAVVALLAIGAALFYWHSTFTEDTDDAQVDGDLYQVSSRIAGQVIKVYVEDNQEVKAGDLLAEIDPKDFQVALEQAQANLANTEAAAIQANVNVPITSITSNTSISTTSSSVQSSQAAIAQSQKQVAAAQARVAQAQANAKKSDLDVERYQPLVEKDVISKQQYDAAVAAAAANRAAVLEAESTLIAQQEAVRQAQQSFAQARSTALEAAKNGPSQIKVQEARARAAEAAVKEAQARVDQAKLNLGYTKILAPTSGIINKKNVNVGANLSVGQDLMTIIPLSNLWVTANFKETQLEHMREGQKVVIKVDALGGKKFHGTIRQIGGATGSRLSLFPPENATGNYVKVVQRIPVRIDFTNLDQENSDHKLRPGYSVVPVVSVK